MSSDNLPDDRPFTVVLAVSGQEYRIEADTTILDTLLEEGFDLPSSCRMGSCGTCETGVIEGTPDHRDHILTPKERAANESMMICCSRSLTERIVLDL